ncbi:MAG: putative response regulator in two-component reguatory system, sigma54 dependent transcriptional, partial [Verrucomicrobiaceae bacterium]|nr:putative response regulator in two-component reguatory system, sigma54 dependent transcriptional [Verrucomicrobiaceae bacterium]
MAATPSSDDSTRYFLVDHDTDFLAWASGHLKAPGVVIETFNKAEDAVAAYQKTKADIVLSELRLQGANGIELLKRLRQLNPNAIVILTSAIASTSHVIEAMRLGAYDVLPKEKLTYELRVVVESAMRSIEGRRATLANPAEVPAETIQE